MATPRWLNWSASSPTTPPVRWYPAAAGDIRKAQRALGHNHVDTTARHYVLDQLELGLTDDLYRLDRTANTWCGVPTRRPATRFERPQSEVLVELKVPS